MSLKKESSLSASTTAAAFPTADPKQSVPSLEFARKQAKELLKAHRAGDLHVLPRLRTNLRGLAGLDDASVLATRLTLASAQHIVAREHGYASWPVLKQHLLWPQFQACVQAMDRGDVDALRQLLEDFPGLIHMRALQPPDADVDYFTGATLLHYVAGNPIRGVLPANIVDAAAVLIEAGADPNVRTVRGSTTIGLIVTSKMASEAGVAAALIGVLQVAGATDGLDPNDEEMLLAPLRNAAPATALALEQRGFKAGVRAAAGLGHLELVRELLAAHDALPVVSGVRPKQEKAARPGRESSWQDVLNQALTYAVIHGHQEIADLLLQKGAEINSIPAVYGNPGTALHIVRDDVAMAQFLVEKGADLFAVDPTFNGTPAGWAEHEGHAQVARYLRSRMAAVT